MNATDDLLARAAVIGLPIRKLTQKRGGGRDLGDTYHPRRVVEIYGVSYTLARARQLLDGLESGKITLDWVQAQSKPQRQPIMTQKRISIYSSPTLERVINARSRGQDEGGRSRSNIVTAVLERYDQIVTRAMPTLTEPEWHLIFDAMNGCITWDSAQLLSGSVLANVQDGIALAGLDKKWLVDGPALVAKLGRLEYPAQVALVDACERFWEFSGNISGPADIVGARCVAKE